MKPVADEPIKTHSNIRVTIQPDGKPSQLGPDLDEKELAAIGWIWSEPRKFHQEWVESVTF